MLCFHNKLAGKIKTEKGTFWVCQQPSTCHFSCSEDRFAKMLCLHNKPAGKIKTEKGTLWVCQQPSTCHFSCSEDQKYLYRGAVERFLGGGQSRPLCCMGEDGVRNHAKMKVVTDMEKESFPRPFFVCSKEDDPCNYFAWGDECIVSRPLCKHGKPCRQEINDQWRSFFCCDEPKEKKCNCFIWFDVFMRPGLRYFRVK